MVVSAVLVDKIFYLSFVAGLCTTAGAILLFIKQELSDRGLAFFLGLASGVMLAVVLFDMLPSALLFSGGMKSVAGVVLGLVFLAVFDRHLFSRMAGNGTLTGLGYLIMLGIAVHDLPEGMAIALGEEMKARTGMVIALGIAIHNIPEGMAIAAPLLMGGNSRLSILLQTFLVGLVTPVGTFAGKISVANLPELLPLLLGFASGIMLYLVLFQLWPQTASIDRKSRWWGLWTGVVIILAATFF